MTEYALNLTTEHLYKSLQERYFVPVRFPMEQIQLREAIQAFFKFLEEPDEIKSHIDFFIAPLHAARAWVLNIERQKIIFMMIIRIFFIFTLPSSKSTQTF